MMKSTGPSTQLWESPHVILLNKYEISVLATIDVYECQIYIGCFQFVLLMSCLY